MAYIAHISAIGDFEKEKALFPKNKIEELEIKQMILKKQREYCSRWLDTESDELYSALEEGWDVVKAEDDFINEKSFSEWSTNIQKNLSNIMPQSILWNMNIPSVVNATKHTGYFNAELDTDGTIRRSRLVARSGNFYMPSIALKG